MPTCQTLLQPLLDLRASSGAELSVPGLDRHGCQGPFESWRTLMQSLFIFCFCLRSWGSTRQKLYFACFIPGLWNTFFGSDCWRQPSSLEPELAGFSAWWVHFLSPTMPQQLQTAALAWTVSSCPKRSGKIDTTHLELIWKAPAPPVCYQNSISSQVPGFFLVGKLSKWVFSAVLALSFGPCSLLQDPPYRRFSTVCFLCFWAVHRIQHLCV